MAHIEIYTKDWCPYCHRAKALLRSENLSFEEIDVTIDTKREREMASSLNLRCNSEFG